MSDPGHSQGPKVSYREVEDDYFQKRQLKRLPGFFISGLSALAQ